MIDKELLKHNLLHNELYLSASNLLKEEERNRVQKIVLNIIDNMFIDGKQRDEK